MIQTNFHQFLTFTDSRDKSFYFRILKGLKALSDDSFTKYSENYLIFPNILTNSTKFNWSFNPVPNINTPTWPTCNYLPVPIILPG